MTRRKRRSLLNRRTPVPNQRVIRTPSALSPVASAEDAPTPPIFVPPPVDKPSVKPKKVPSAQSSQTSPVRGARPSIPPDPGLVEFDRTADELPELPVDAFEEIDDFDDFDEMDADFIEELPSDPRAAVKRTPETPDAPAESPEPLGSSPVPSVVLPMGLAFGGSLAATMVVVLVPWFAFVSPGIEASRIARADALRATEPRVIEVPMPVAIPTAEPEAEPEGDATADASAEPEVPEVIEEPPRPVVVPSPSPRPTARPRPAPKASPSPKPKSQPVAKPAPVAESKPPTPSSASNDVPKAARALNGTVSGTANKFPVTMTFEFKPQGKLAATINRNGKTISAFGSYTMSVGRASFSLKESGSSTRYSGVLSSSGATGKVTFDDGQSGKLKAKR